MMHKAGSFRHILRDASGATAVEFALLGAPTMLLLVAVFVVGFSFFLEASLDQATLSAGRAVAVGAVSPANLTASQFKQNYVCANLPAAFSCSNVFVNMKVVPTGSTPSGYYAYVNANKSGLVQPPLNSSQDTFCPGAGSQYVVLQVLYPVPTFVAWLVASSSTTFNGQQANVLMSSMTFKSEPYANAATYTGC